MGIRRGLVSLFLHVALSILLVFTSACSLINPHVTWGDPPKPTVGSPEVALQAGIDYANEAKKAYKKAIGEQASLTSWMGIILIPLGAAAIGMGIGESNPVSTAALGLSGAAGLGVGSWLSSRPRQLIYAEGIKAMNCAVDAMLPLNFTDEERNNLKLDLKRLNDAIGDAQGKAGAMKSFIENAVKLGLEADVVVRSAKESVDTADTILETAMTTWMAGTRLERELARAGQVLSNAVDRIDADVSRQLVTTLSDPQALPSVINGLAQTSAQFGKVPEPPKTEEQMPGRNTQEGPRIQGLQQDPQKKVLTDLNNGLETLKQSAKTLREATRKVAAVVNAVSETRPSETLKQCGVAEIVTDITVQPAGPILCQQGKAATKGLVVSGGKPPYTARFLDDPGEGLTVSQPVPFGPTVTIKATDNAPVGKFTLHIADTAGHAKFVEVEVKAAPPGQ